jgi:hypothetical protein
VPHNGQLHSPAEYITHNREISQAQLQIADSHRASLNSAESCFAQKGNNVARTNVAVRAVEVGEKGSLLISHSLEVNYEHTSTRF